MSKLNYFNATGNEIDTKEKISEILKEMADILAKSYSPFGSSSIIINDHKVTKDGYSILNSLKPESELAIWVTNMVRSLTNKTLLTSGDGKTTAVLLAEALFENLNHVFENKYKGRTSQDFISDVNNLGYSLIDALNSLKYVPKNKEEFLNIAYTSLNNDQDLTNYVKEAMDIFEDPMDMNIITSVSDGSSEIKVEISEGVKIKSSLMFGLGNVFNNAVIKKCKVFVAGEKIESLEQINKIFEVLDFVSDTDTKLMFLAPEYSATAKRKIRQRLQKMNMEQKNIGVFFLNIDRGGTLDSREHYEDVMAYLGTVVLNIQDSDDFIELFKDNYDKLSVSDVKVGVYNTTFIIKKRNSEILYKERIELLKRQLEHGELQEKQKARYRLKKMTSKVADIKVGSNIPEETQRVYSMFMDATLAMNYAKDGIVSGMNTAMIKTINEFDFNDEGLKAIAYAIRKSYRKLFDIIIDMSRRDISLELIDEITHIDINDNKGILKTYDVKNEEITYTITNPFQSEKVILLAALEIVKIFITANQIIFSDVY
ncbi:MAG: TCP-1/cpn60 chaperonin family protein, partial [Candidatus Woesearchaeota archaeon]